VVLLCSLLQAQVDPVVEFWYGLSWPNGRQFQFHGQSTVNVGNATFYDGPVTYTYNVFADSSFQHRWLMDIYRQDTSGFSGYNFSFLGHQAFSYPPGNDTLLPAGLYVFTFPFLDVNTVDFTYDFPISSDTVPTPSPPAIYDLAPYLQQQTSRIRLQLDPYGVYDAQSADTLIPDSLVSTIWLIDEGVDTSLTVPLFCDAAFLPIKYHILLDDTVYMWDGSTMYLQQDRFLWMSPTCGIIKDSVYRTMVPAKRAKKAQSQTVTTSIVLDNVALLRQERVVLPTRRGNVRIQATLTHWILSSPEGIRRVVVRDLAGRVLQRWRGPARIPYPHAGVFVLDVETQQGSRTRIKVPAFSP
jgi:hypothetical protein